MSQNRQLPWYQIGGFLSHQPLLGSISYPRLAVGCVPCDLRGICDLSFVNDDLWWSAIYFCSQKDFLESDDF